MYTAFIEIVTEKIFFRKLARRTHRTCHPNVNSSCDTGVSQRYCETARCAAEALLPMVALENGPSVAREKESVSLNCYGVSPLIIFETNIGLSAASDSFGSPRQCRFRKSLR